MEDAIKKEGKLSAGAKLTRAAWRVMKLDKELIGIGAISMTINILVFAIFVTVCVFFVPEVFNLESSSGWQYYAALTLYMFAAYVVTNFFNGAVSHAAFRRFDGNNPTFKEALAAARSKASPLLAFTGLQTTVGLILNIVGDRVPFANRIAVWLAGAAWGVASMFSIPVIMSTDEKNPLKVVKKSAKTLTSIWQESVFIGLSLGAISIVVTVLTMVVVLTLFVMAIQFSSVILFIASGAVLVAVFTGLILITNTLQTVLVTAAYYYASTGRLPAGFDEELIRSMFRPKKKWLNS